MDTPESSDDERAGLPQTTAEYLDALEAEVERLRSLCADLCGEENLAIEGEYKTEMRKLVDEVERLRAELDTTADGVPVVPDMPLWHYCKYKKEVRPVNQRTEYTYMPSDGRSQLNIQHTRPSECWSTLEKAEAAKEAAQ